MNSLILLVLLAGSVTCEYTLEVQFSHGIPDQIELRFQDTMGKKTETLILELNDIEQQADGNWIRVQTEKEINPRKPWCPSVSYKISKDNSYENAILSLEIIEDNKSNCKYNQIKTDGPFVLGTEHNLKSEIRLFNILNNKRNTLPISITK